jgi:hypothetical protein
VSSHAEPECGLWGNAQWLVNFGKAREDTTFDIKDGWEAHVIRDQAEDLWDF